MNIPEKQGVYYAVFCETLYDSLDDALARDPDIIASHRTRSKELYDQGMLLMAGAFLDSPEEKLCSMAICLTREAAEAYARGDPFVPKGERKSVCSH